MFLWVVRELNAVNQQKCEQSGIRDGLCIVAKILKIHTESLYSLVGGQRRELFRRLLFLVFFRLCQGSRV